MDRIWHQLCSLWCVGSLAEGAVGQLNSSLNVYTKSIAGWSKTASELEISPKSWHPNYFASEALEEKVRGNNDWVCFLRGSIFWQTQARFLFSPPLILGPWIWEKSTLNFKNALICAWFVLKMTCVRLFSEWIIHTTVFS